MIKLNTSTSVTSKKLGIRAIGAICNCMLVLVKLKKKADEQPVTDVWQQKLASSSLGSLSASPSLKSSKSY